MTFDKNLQLKMKVLSPKVGAVTLKVERPLVAGFPGGSGDNTVTNTKAGEWEELTYDFSASPTPIDPAGQYARITLIWDIVNLPTEDVVYYFDDIRLDGGDCGQESSVFDPLNLEKLHVSPNPVSDILRINNAETLQATDIINVFGQRLARVYNNHNQQQTIDVSNLPSGTYILLGYNDKQQAVAQSRFVKM